MADDARTHVETQHREKGKVEQAKDKAGEVAEKAREQTKEVAHEAKHQTKSTVEARKGQAVGELDDVAEAFRTTGHQLRTENKETVADYSERIADQVNRFSRYLENRDVDEMIAEAEDMARQRPELFLGGAFAFGLFIGRFLKSSGDRRHRHQVSVRNYQEEPEYNYFGDTDVPEPEPRRDDVVTPRVGA
jgi:ElaB/YqjD/DUF883 family membrane-anchored ribosome-binding protein